MSDHCTPLTHPLGGTLSLRSGIGNSRDCRRGHSCVPFPPLRETGEFGSCLTNRFTTHPTRFTPDLCLTSGRPRFDLARWRSLHPDATAPVSAATGHTSDVRDTAPNGSGTEFTRNSLARDVGKRTIPRYMAQTKAPWLARLLFPKHQPHLQRQHLRQLLWAIAIGVLVAGTIAGIMVWKGTETIPH